MRYDLYILFFFYIHWVRGYVWGVSVYAHAFRVSLVYSDLMGTLGTLLYYSPMCSLKKESLTDLA